MSERSERVTFMQQMVDLTYESRVSPVQRRFDEHMVKGHITGQKCPSCGRVYVPPKGYCVLCTVSMTDEHEVDVADKGIVASFTVLTPIQYRGQKEREPYVLANLLLDGADATVGQQRIGGLPPDQVRMGLRVKAEWAPESERAAAETGGRGWGFGSAIKHWVPTGEPDAPREHYQEHIL